MYAFIDRPVESLGNSGRFLLWAMRGWVAAAERGQCPPQALRRGFASVQALAALPDFHVVMALINSDALEAVALARIDCPRIAEDEAIWLNLWCDIAKASARVDATLTLLVDPDVARPMAAAMAAVIANLDEAGFDLADISPAATPSQESQNK
ncbi:MAG: hypothetical protein IBJ13_04690 [Sphingopyxis sp.]|nr:hypothetical protein [Sphingopyxis sp.]